jgi:hypothetical protein
LETLTFVVVVVVVVGTVRAFAIGVDVGGAVAILVNLWVHVQLDGFEESDLQ